MYQVILVASDEQRRDYKARQLFANEQGADFYLELHFNAARYDKPGTQDNPASCLVADNAGEKTRAIGTDFAKACSLEFGYPNRGLVVLKQADRAYYNLYYTKMPAILVEPFYVSDVEQAAMALSPTGQQRVAEILWDLVRAYFPAGSKIAISLGHKFKATSIHDRGAPVVIGHSEEGDPIYHPTMAEADCAERVMGYLVALLRGEIPAQLTDSDILIEGPAKLTAVGPGVLKVSKG